jgi:glutathione S-transferase
LREQCRAPIVRTESRSPKGTIMTTTSAAQFDRFYRFYASEVSYFSGKLRPALRYKRLPFAEILSTADVYRTVIRPRTGLSYIPVIVTPEDEVWQDTSDILDAIEARYAHPPLYPRTPVQHVLSLLIELYADEFLIIPGLHYRWSFAESEAKARADFAATNGDVDAANHFADRIKSFVPLIGVTPETIPAIEAHTRELLEGFSAHLGQHAYVWGGRPSLADCALIGPLYPHLYLDAVPGRLLRERAPRVCHWIERMNHPNPDENGAWLANDALAPTLRPLLDGIGADAVPLILDTVRAFEAWADTRPCDTDEPPRGVGMHRSRLRGVAVDRVTSPYTLWMVQRPLDAYRRLTPGEREAVDRAIAGTGCEALFAYQPRHRLGKRHFKLIVEPRGR